MTSAQQTAHDAATEAWSKTGRHSRTTGLAEMMRGSGRKPQTVEQRQARQKAHKDRLHRLTDQAHKKAVRFNVRKLDRSSYFPHQSGRERNRRVANR